MRIIHFARSIGSAAASLEPKHAVSLCNGLIDEFPHERGPKDQEQDGRGQTRRGATVGAALAYAEQLEVASVQELVDTSEVGLGELVLPANEDRELLAVVVARAEGQHHVRGYGLHHVDRADELLVRVLLGQGACGQKVGGFKR